MLNISKWLGCCSKQCKAIIGQARPDKAMLGSLVCVHIPIKSLTKTQLIYYT